MVRRHPVDGVARGIDGKLHHVHVNETRLLEIAEANMLNAGELAAAADALAVGDEKPLLRLAAEIPPGGGNAGDPALFSAGDNAAAFCNDSDFVWNRHDSVALRRAKYHKALRALGPRSFAPFSPRVWAKFYVADFCLRWPAPDRFTPAVPRGATVTGAPALILSGDLDTNVPTETTRRLLKVFRGARFLHIAGAAHPAIGWSECAQTVTQRFIRTLALRGATCSKPAYIAPAVPAFPRTSAEATPAHSLPGDASTKADRRVVTVAVRAVLDAWLRSFRIPGAIGKGYALRGGTFHFDYATFNDHAVIRLHGVRFAREVAVDGRSTLMYASNAMHIQMRVIGPASRRGRLRADGEFGFGAPFSAFTVTGSLGGRTVDATVPAN
jgi:hypothetical protein